MAEYVMFVLIMIQFIYLNWRLDKIEKKIKM